MIIMIISFTNCAKETSPKACCDVPTTGTAGTAVTFSSACSSNANEFKWTFGDGDSSLAANTTHIYTASGTYTVKLMAMKGSKMDEISKSISIN